MFKLRRGTLILMVAVAVIATVFVRDLYVINFRSYVWREWTGYAGKTFWDIFEVIVVPGSLVWGAWYLNVKEKERAAARILDQQYQKTLEDYFDCISDLLLRSGKNSLKKNEDARNVARTRTIVALQNLDIDRKAQILQFLLEAGLITKNPIVNLNGADLSNANLKNACLKHTEIRGAYFTDANLRDATIDDTTLTSCDFSKADLSGAVIKNTDLSYANFTNANLENIDFQESTLVFADFTGAKMKAAIISRSQLDTLPTINKASYQPKII